ncbi:hypothetical protein J1N10_13925 [Carboxylicivirga sp. A043]|uniref:hypothetical protein n=1 Tax=Carboxylicivirga litoralis TaxID=2816963 RepID=UPI0021CB9625|nr:hypothetical protein [Carboxylicivirga sp. A043]MCU4157082.1 hypothetical protein [Carboxylicivirga sp. A043]
MYRLVLSFSFALLTLNSIAQINIQKDGTISNYKTTGQTKAIAGAEYYVATQEDTNGATYTIKAIPANGEHTRNISESEFEKVKSAFEKEFDVELVYHPINAKEKNEGTWSAQRDHINFQIIVDNYDKADYYPYEIMLSITNLH